MHLFILSTLYLILPAGAANMAPVFAEKWDLPFGWPISARLFGGHKTWRGFYAAYGIALLTVFLQRELSTVAPFSTLSLMPYATQNVFLLAFLFSTGTLLMDLFKSFLKRRLGMPAGSSWFPFDQLDILGGVLFLEPYFPLSLGRIAVIALCVPILHVVVNLLAYVTGYKKVWW